MPCSCRGKGHFPIVCCAHCVVAPPCCCMNVTRRMLHGCVIVSLARCATVISLHQCVVASLYHGAIVPRCMLHCCGAVLRRSGNLGVMLRHRTSASLYHSVATSPPFRPSLVRLATRADITVIHAGHCDTAPSALMRDGRVTEPLQHCATMTLLCAFVGASR